MYELGNLRKAADVLHMSHSALSKSLQVFQQQIGVTLLMPVGRGLVPTDQGVECYPRFKRLLRQEEELFSTSQPTASIIRIGTFEVFSTHLLAAVWTQYFVDSGLELHELLPGPLKLALLQQRVDLGVTYESVHLGPLSGEQGRPDFIDRAISHGQQRATLARWGGARSTLLTRAGLPAPFNQGISRII